MQAGLRMCRLFSEALLGEKSQQTKLMTHPFGDEACVFAVSSS